MWKDILATVAPTIATALTGGNPLAGMTVRWLMKKVLGTDEGKTEADLEQWFEGATPENLQQLKKIDNDFKLEMRKLEIDVYKTDAADRASARTFGSNTTIAPQVILSVVYTGAYVLVLYLFMTGQVNIDPQYQGLFNTVLGILTAAQMQIMNFWFGSSSGSKQKTAHMADNL